MTIRAFLIRV